MVAYLPQAQLEPHSPNEEYMSVYYYRCVISGSRHDKGLVEVDIVTAQRRGRRRGYLQGWRGWQGRGRYPWMDVHNMQR